MSGAALHRLSGRVRRAIEMSKGGGRWRGDPAMRPSTGRATSNEGGGNVDLASSHAAEGLSVSLPTRSSEQTGGQTSPEELIAGAHPGCYAMALSMVLSQGGNPPEALAPARRSPSRRVRRRPGDLSRRPQRPRPGARARRRGLRAGRSRGRAGLRGLERAAWQRPDPPQRGARGRLRSWSLRLWSSPRSWSARRIGSGSSARSGG